MFKIGRTIFYDKKTGILLHDTGDIQTTLADFLELVDYYSAVKALQERDPKTVGELKLKYGQYAADYNEGGRIERVDTETGVPLFIYPPDPGETEPILQQPALSKRLEKAETEVASLRAADLDNREMINGLAEMLMALMEG